MTMRTFLVFALLAFALAGCSKKEVAVDVSQQPASTNADQAAAEPAAEPAPADAAPAPDIQVVNVQIAQDLNALPDTLQKQDYDGAVDTLTAAKLSAATPEQIRAYQEQMYRTLDYLRQKAETDAKAQEAYQKLGRRMMGR